MRAAERLPLTAACKHYSRIGEVPWDIQKYWHQRYSIFSYYDYDIRLTDDAWFGVTPEPVATQIATDLAGSAPPSKTILVDLFAGAGGNAIAFALSGRWDRVVAVEKDAATLACAQHNAEMYEVPDGLITWVNDDCFEYLALLRREGGGVGAQGGSPARHSESDSDNDSSSDSDSDSDGSNDIDSSSDSDSGSSSRGSAKSDSKKQGSPLDSALRIDLTTAQIFASPPWGGVGYGAQAVFDVEAMQPYGLTQLHEACRPYAHALYLPRTSDLRQIARLVPEGRKVEVVQYCMEGASKAMVAYIPDADEAAPSK
ncbi:hypothetical protein NKR23_g635 [Pleurostoma richardsiae]|uniref:Trimethylguanosine synthase n=1 Tax=Pleurostoma richardsiae TaxID=41990 RepID=A0AA38RV56_9PEZI|nr:hypothetical protein NKR23_g635 [Pleurostoma richardsiae]